MTLPPVVPGARRPVAPPPQRLVGIVLAALGILFVVGMTLTPQPEGATPSEWCLICGEVGGTDFLLNVALFVPFGLGLRLAGVPQLRALALVVATTLAVELLQLQLVSGRDASIGDLVANSLGGAGGVVLATHWRTLVLPGATAARRLAVAGAALALGALAGATWALTTSMPSTEYAGQLAPCLAGYGQFRGKIVAADLDGTPVPNDVLPEDARRRLRSGRARLTATVIPAGPHDTLAPIVSLFDDDEREILMLAQDGRDLVFRVRRHASDARLRSPRIRVRDVFPAAPPETPQPVRLTAGLDGHRAYVAAEPDGGRQAAALAPDPGLGWALLVPFDVSVTARSRPVSLLWLAALLFPVGYWAAWWSLRAAPTQGSARGRAALLLAATIGLGLIAVPTLFGVRPAHWLEVLAALAGAAAGWTVGRRLARRAHHGAPDGTAPKTVARRL